MSSSEVACAEQSRHEAPRSPLEVRSLRADQLRSTAELHARELPNGLFPALGARFLAAWHRTFLDTDHAAAAVVVDTSDGDAVAGFLLLALQPVEHVQELKVRHRRELLLRGLAGLVRRPVVAVHFLRTRALHYARRLLSGRRRPAEDGGEELAPAVVHAVVTCPEHAGRGAARRLLQWAAVRAEDAGVREVALVTDADEAVDGGVLAPESTGGAAAMYDRLGWRRVAHRHRDGRSLVEFRLDVSARRASGDD